MRFRDRREAGQKLARMLDAFRHDSPLVLGLPRGGVPVAAEVASRLGAQLDVWVVRKVGAPGHEEFGIGAVAEGGAVHVDRDCVRASGATDGDVTRGIARKKLEVAERVRTLRGRRGAPHVQGRTVIVVDDGIATGVTLRAVLQDLRARNPANLVVAVPVADAHVAQFLRMLADEVVVVHETRDLGSVGQWYEDFGQVGEEQVEAALRRAARAEGPSPVQNVELCVDLGDARLEGVLTIPSGARSLVLFAHGSGSGRLSPRNHHVAWQLGRRGIGTFLFDLLTGEEEARDARSGQLRFDIGFLARRLAAVTEWIRRRPEAEGLAIGYFGASTGAAAALAAAADLPGIVRAVVSRGGRPDLAAERLSEVRAPTLLIVGEQDDVVLALNRRVLSRIHAPKDLVVVPGASHLFEERGALDAVARLAADWFDEHLGREVEPKSAIAGR